jgi:hypothetical protein
MAMVAIVTLAKDCMLCNHNNPTINQSQTIAVQGLQLTTLNLNHFKTVEDMGLKRTAMNGIISVPNFMKIYQAVQKLLVGDTQTHTDRQTGDSISLI